MLDSNGEEIAKQTAITNDYGSVSGEFSLPQGILPGNFSIASDEGAYFQVVEYKRPTFEVTFEKIDQTYKFEEEIQLKGSVKNFSGISLQQTTVGGVLPDNKPGGGAGERGRSCFPRADNHR